MVACLVLIASTSAGAAVEWVRGYGLGNRATIVDIDIDSAGNAVIAGRFYRSATIGGEWVEGGQDTDFHYVARLDGLGHATWIKTFVSELQTITALAVGPNDDIYLTGASHVHQPRQDLPVFYLSVYGQSGALKWSIGADSGSARDQSLGSHGAVVDVDEVGNIALGIISSDDFSLGGYTVKPWLASTDYGTGVVARLGPDGEFRWSVPIGGYRDNIALAITDLAFDGDGNIVVGGSFDSIADFPAEGRGGYLARFSPNGMVDWLEIFRSSSQRTRYHFALAIGTDNSVGAAFRYHDDVQFAGGIQRSDAAWSAGFVRFRPSGELVQQRYWSGADTLTIGGLDIDDSNHAWLGGTFRGSLTIGYQTYWQTSDAAGAAYIARIHGQTGLVDRVLRSSDFGTDDSAGDSVIDLAAASSNRVYAAGNYANRFRLGDIDLSNTRVDRDGHPERSGFVALISNRIEMRGVSGLVTTLMTALMLTAFWLYLRRDRPTTST